VQKKGSARPGGAEAASAAQQSYALQQAVKNFPVVVYTSKECSDAYKKGIDHMKKRGVRFTEKVVAKQDKIDELIKLAGAARGPVMVIGVTMRKDYQEQSWNEALDTAGFPKTGAP